VMNDDIQMRSDWLIPICQGEERIKINGQKAHSTQKPAELLYRIIISTSNPGDIVLDPFSGSGTTAAVAKRLGRKYIAFEKEALYVKISQERVQKIIPIEKPLLEYLIEKRNPKVPFGNLIEKGYVKIGEFLYSNNCRYSAQVMADSSINYNGEVGSIHKISALILGKTNNNGWGFWFVKRDNTLVSINDLRHQYEQEQLRVTKSDIIQEIIFNYQ